MRSGIPRLRRAAAPPRTFARRFRGEVGQLTRTMRAMERPSGESNRSR